jgi:CheY-like chemotaxis protein
METSSLQAALTHTRSALVIDDSSVERMLAGAVLERLGFSVSCTDSAEQALALLAQRGFDLVVCDIALPGMDGLALLAAIRRYPASPPCIVLSAHDDAQHASAALRGGALAYLVKPLRLATMRDALDGIFPLSPTSLPVPNDASPLARLCAGLGKLKLRHWALPAQTFSDTLQATDALAGQPEQSAAAGLLPAGIRATG